jgi:hypothetical protein
MIQLFFAQPRLGRKTKQHRLLDQMSDPNTAKRLALLLRVNLMFGPKGQDRARAFAELEHFLASQGAAIEDMPAIVSSLAHAIDAASGCSPTSIAAWRAELGVARPPYSRFTRGVQNSG